MNMFGARSGLFGSMPPVIKALILINALIFVTVNWFLGLLTIGGVPVEWYVVQYFGLQPLATAFPNLYVYLWQLITYQFLHGGFWHIFMNMFILWMFGVELEQQWGSKRFLAYYLLCGIGAGIANVLISPLFSQPAPTIGASGAIYGVLLAFALHFPNRLVIVFPLFFPIPARILIFGYIILDLVLGVTGSGGNVARFAHVGGALFGWFLLRYGDRFGILPAAERVLEKVLPRRLFYGPLPPPPRYQVTTTAPPPAETPSWFRVYSPEEKPEEPLEEEQRRQLENEVDRILDKLQREGYQSLTDEEKRILYEASKRL